MIAVNVPVPPSANRMFTRQTTRKGKRRLTPEYIEWRDRAGWELKRQIVGIPVIDCRFDVRIEVPVSRKDTDNHVKPLLDLCQNMGLISNDGNQRKVEISPVAGRIDCLIVITPLPGEPGVRKAVKPRSYGPAAPRKKPLTAAGRKAAATYARLMTT